MKISKKLLSLLLCMTMLVSATAFASMTSAPQTDAKDLAWFTEPFSASGKTVANLKLRGDDTQTTANLAPYKTIATFTYPERTAGSGDYYTTLNVYANENKNTNASGTAGLRYETGPFVLKDRMFSVSYDICFHEVPASGVIISLVGTNNTVAGASATGINRTIFEGVANNTTSVGLWDENSDNTVDIGKWYSVHHFFDNKACYEYMTITDEEGNVIKLTPQATKPTLMQDVNTITMISLTSPQACKYSVDNFTFKDESVSLETAADTFLTADDVTLTATIPVGFDKAVVMADGDIIGQIIPVSEKNVYDITIPANDLGLGNHELILSASYSDGITRTNATTVTVTNEYETGVLSTTGTHPTTVETFDHLWQDTYVLSDGKKEIKYNYIQNNTTSWQSANSQFLVPGASGAAGDYAISTNKSTGLLQVKSLAKPPVTKGDFVIEFDMLLTSSSTSVTINNLDSGSTGNFITGNKIFGNQDNNIPIEANVWTHVKLVCNENATALSAFANGKEATINANVDLKNYTYFRFTLKNDTSFAIDNARIYNVVTDPVINSAAYVTADGETETTGAIPADATAIKLNMSEALDVTSADVALYADGEAIAAKAVVSSDGVVTITLPELEANTDLKLVLDDSIDGISSALSHNFYVTDSGIFFNTAGVVTSDNTATAVIRHMGSGTSNAIVAAYSGNQLVSINVCDFKSAADIGAVNVSASTAGADEIKIMAWNTLSSATPKMTAASYKLD